jgi:transglutaminase-like putative cysteine protease
MVIPSDRHNDQSLLSYDLSVGGVDDPRLVWQEDPIGNRVATIECPRVDRSLSFDVSYQVERGLDPAAPIPPTSLDLSRYLEPTSLTEPSSALAAVAARLQATSVWPRGRAYRAHHWAAAALRYQPGATTVETTAAEAATLGVGVCQDYTHVLLTVLRLMGIAARYVSGHLLGEGAPHAWVEALFPDPTTPGAVSVIAYDPANRRQPGRGYITVAVGRDYADVTPTSGWFVGAARSQLTTRQTIELVEVDSPSSR